LLQLTPKVLNLFFSNSSNWAVALLMLFKRSAFLGSVLTMGLMTGAILSHVFILGIEFNGDGGALFSLACVCFFAASVVARMNFKGFDFKNY
jgi:hypothetical protein